MKESTATLKTADGLDLYLRHWEAEGTPHQWTFVVVHGLGEHGGRYQHFAEWFTPLGATVYAMDHRGHGRSGGQRGHAPSLDALLEDIDQVVVRARSESGGPVVLVGHSFGGLLAIAYALRHQDHLDRAVFSAPLLKVKVKVPAWKRGLANVLPKVAPRMSLSNEVDPDVLSHDPANARAYRSDPLVHDRITAGLYGDTIARGEEFIARAAELRLPFLLLHGRDDQVVDPIGSQRFFARATAPDRAFCLYPGLYHEIFNEVDHEQVFQDIHSWLTQRTDAQRTGWNPPP
ncbi:MAG TPA: alpha/beta hydrolase [Candidatus Dormibacteraeota bacterium]|nr:alpha/beta hydrolase [Candidatus Dormibacteraeota bacterium]